MTGFLVVNTYLGSGKFNALHRHLVDTAYNMGIELEIRTNEEMIFFDERTDKRPDFVLFWDKDTALARLLEKRGLNVFNSARSIELCDDKAKTYLALLGKVPQPETIIAPLSFFKTDYGNFIKKAGQRLGFPLVFKERRGSFGEQVYLCKNENEAQGRVSERPFLLQKFISASSGEDVRIEVAGGKVIAAMKRKNKNDFRSNITNGGSAENYEPSEYEKSIALKACEILGLDFCGVDILNDGSVCEVNSNAHIINLLNVTGVDAAQKIFEHIIKEIKK